MIKATTGVFDYILAYVQNNWSRILEFDDRQFEEIIAGYFHSRGFITTLTPRTGDLGRDIIAQTQGVGCLKAAAVRDLMGALSMDPNASKATLITTSDFAPRLSDDPGIVAAQPFRLELVNGAALQERLRELRRNASSSSQAVTVKQ